MGAAEDLSTCVEILPRVSRTFALSIEALPEELREAVRVSYLLCRVVDTIEDARELPAGLRETLFDGFDALLSGDTMDVDRLAGHAAAFEGQVSEHDVDLMERCGAVFRRFWSLDAGQQRDIRGPVLRMSKGMRSYTRRWQRRGKLHISTVDDLEQYCYYVAGTVGELLTALFLRYAPLDDEAVARLQGHCVAFGTGLQLVNILKDVAEDARRGVCYVPEDLLEARGLRPRELLDAARRDDALAALQPIIELARQQLDAAMEYTRAWPAAEADGVRLFLIVPLVLALRTLSLIEEGGREVLRAGHSPKVSREFVYECLEKAREAAGNADACEALFHDALHAGRPRLELSVHEGGEGAGHDSPWTLEGDALQDYLARQKARIESALDELVPEREDDAGSQDAGLSKAVRYSLLAGGKRLRPVLFLAASEALGRDAAPAIPAACALELIHSYSLIHDDLPAMDDAPLRRGRPTSHMEFGEATAILAGDALLTDAFGLISGSASAEFDASARLACLDALVRAAGSEGMVLGQMLDMEGETRELHLGELVRLHAHKTGALLRFAVEGAAILWGASEDDRSALRRYGERIGLAFQIADDVLDVVSDAETLGKATGADVDNDKTTFPRLMGLEASRERARTLVEQAKLDLERFGARAAALRGIADYVVERVQ